MIAIRNANLDDAYSLAPRLREADRREIAALSGVTPLTALVASLNRSTVARAVLIDDRVHGMFGYSADPLGRAAMVWALGSDHLPKKRIALIKEMKQFLDGVQERHGRLVNIVDVDNTDAIELLKKNNDNFQYKVEWGTDLQTEHERYLTEQIFKKPVFVTDYPKEIKAFYMRQNEDGKTVAAADMLVPGIGELIGGSQREERLDVLEARMKELGLNTADYDWYLDLRRYGSVKHAGYGLGFERLLMYVTGIPNIRDVIPFPRTCGGF